MKSLYLFLVVCTLSVSSYSQDTVNKTDAKGLKQGKWVGRYPGGTLKYEGVFEQGKPVGEWKRFHENGKLKAIMSYRYSSDRLFASLYDDAATLYAKGVFEGSLRDSTWNFYSGELLVLVENYRLGKREGKSTAFSREGKILWEKELKNDLVEGVSVEYYPTGLKKSEIHWVEGKKNGYADFFDESGLKTTEGNYRNDLSDGIWKIYDKSGKLKYQITYANGNIVNGNALDSVQMKEFKKYDKVRGKIPEPKVNEVGLP